jgi:carbonic anhydrase
MKTLIDGVLEFKDGDFVQYRELFERIQNKQQPHTLFIGCSDSRIVPTLITKTLPGELFVVRNIANIVPPYRKTTEYVATTSAIEYALSVLKVDHIVICGHSNCGGCAALYLPSEELAQTPHVEKWLEQLADIKTYVLSRQLTEPATRTWITELMNIKKQIKNLFTYPTVLERVEQGTLQLHGWYYLIGSGDVFSYNPKTTKFEQLTTER